MKPDPTTIEVVKGALIYTAEEMGIALKKSAYSPNIKERMDHSCAVFDHKRRLIAQAEHIPVHLGSMALAVRLGLEAYDGLLKSGDMILLNDPYLSGTHLPDLTLIAPIFCGEALVGYAANKAHHTDIGGKAPGSIAGDSTELYQEGLIIPPVKLLKSGEIDSELIRLISNNVRTPDIQMGDLRAQIAANRTGIKRVQELVDNYGLETVQAVMESVMDYSERRMLTQISMIPEGIYEAVDYIEDIGSSDRQVKIVVKVKVRDGRIFFDYSGTDRQVDGPVNAPLGVTMAGIYYTLISVTDPTIPVNDGCFRPVGMIIPEGSVMNPIRPAPVAGGNVETSQRNVDVLMRALSKAIPGKVPAAGPGTMSNISIGIAFAGTSGGVISGNDCSLNGNSGIAVGEEAHPNLKENVCAHNGDYGIVYHDLAIGVARGNECSGNRWGIYIKATADPELIDNDCHDNSEADIVDER